MVDLQVIACADINEGHSDYQHGMANGIRCALSMIDGADPGVAFEDMSRTTYCAEVKP